MNIGIDGSRAFIPNRTGTENYSYQIIKHLSLIDQTNNYIIFLRPGNEPGKVWPANFRFVTIKFPRLWTQLGLASKTWTQKLDILFVPAHTLPIVRKPGLKTVVTVHDLGAEYLPSMHQVKQRLYLNLMTHHQLKSASHLIAVSQATKDDLIKKVNIPFSKVSVIYEGYDQSLFQPVKGDSLVTTLKQLELVAGNYWLFVGSIQPRKNLARLIEAFSNYLIETESDDQLVIAGGKGWQSEAIYGLPKQLGIEKQIRFLGFVPDQQLSALYSGAKALLFPSLFEGFGLPLVEAMACGCPVLTSDTSSMPEVVGSAGIKVSPTSTSSITEGIRTLANPVVREKVIKAGFRQVKQFSWSKAAQQTLEILEKTAKL